MESPSGILESGEMMTTLGAVGAGGMKLEIQK